MNICYVCDANFSGTGGAAKSAQTICKAMWRRGHEVSIITIGNKESSRIEGCKIFTYKEPGNVKHVENSIYKGFMRIYKALIYIYFFHKKDFDVVHVHSSASAKIIAVLIKMRFIKKKAKFIFNDRDYFDVYSNRGKRLYVKTIDSWDIIICTTENNKNEWLSNCGKEFEDKFVVIPNALESFWFEYDKDKKKKIRERSGITDNNYVIGFAGRCVAWKRWDTAIEVAEKLCPKSNIRIAIAIGSGGTEDEVKAVVNQFKEIVGDKLILLVEADIEAMIEFYYLLDFFVLTTDRESFGRTLIEAMTKSCVVLATNSGGAPNVLEHDENLFPVGDAEAACSLIRKYINDKDMMDDMREKYMILAQEKYTEKKMIDLLEKLYYSIK